MSDDADERASLARMKWSFEREMRKHLEEELAAAQKEVMGLKWEQAIHRAALVSLHEPETGEDPEAWLKRLLDRVRDSILN